MGSAFRHFSANALARKPLRLVRRQAHLGDASDSRYESPSLVVGPPASSGGDVDLLGTTTTTSGEGTSELGAGVEGGVGGPLSPLPAKGSGEGGKGGDGVVPHREREAPLRHMSLFDLVAYGIGTTVGSGVFVLAGLAAREYAGPSSAISYLLAGFVASLSGLPYAELSASFPVDGSTYSASTRSTLCQPPERRTEEPPSGFDEVSPSVILCRWGLVSRDGTVFGVWGSGWFDPSRRGAFRLARRCPSWPTQTDASPGEMEVEETRGVLTRGIAARFDRRSKIHGPMGSARPQTASSGSMRQSTFARSFGFATSWGGTCEPEGKRSATFGGRNSPSGLSRWQVAGKGNVEAAKLQHREWTGPRLFAVIASLCQTLEYGIAGAAVARSWGSKFADWVQEGHGQNAGGNSLPSGLERFFHPGHGINPMAAIMTLLCTIVLLLGVQESKLATNVVSTTKVLLILFIVVAGMLMSSGILPDGDKTPASFSNWDPFVPPEFGPEGIVNGASILFFAYLGFDCICNLAGEAKDPVRDVPRAVVTTIVVDGVIYMLAALTLTAMVPYDEINVVSGFPRAFGANGWIWAEQLTAIGELVVLPLVVLTSIQAQSRLFFAMSKDGIVPKFFGKLYFSKRTSTCCGKTCEDKIGNITKNLQFCGAVLIVLSLLVPFHYLDDLVSAGALLLFSMTDCCLLVIRYKCPSESFLGSVRDIDENASIISIATVRKELSLGRILFLLNLFPFASGLCFAFIPVAAVKWTLTALFSLLTLGVTVYIAAYCPEISSNRFVLDRDGYGTGTRRFRTPLVPFLPALGIYMNWFMLAHVGWKGIAMLVGYLLLGVLAYGTFCSGKSIITASDDIDEGYRDRNMLTGRTSPTGGNQYLHQALLEEDWEEERGGRNGRERGLREDLSEIEKVLL
ncbi:hypothetical protein ACHAWF_008274 [Thalassiosira exigua]